MRVSPGRAAGARAIAAGVGVVAAAAAAATVAAVPDLNRYVVLLGALTVVAALAAAAQPGRLVGTLAVLMAAMTVLLAGTVDASSLRPVQAVVDAALLVALIAALGAQEGSTGRSPHAASVPGRPGPARWAAPLMALGAGVLVAVTAAQDVVPSVPLVLAGLAAAVVSLVVAAGAHRG